MKKRCLTFYYIILMLICPVLSVSAVSEVQKTDISSNCEIIKDNLKKVQKNDARARVYLGAYYESVLSKFIVPLNVRLVENNISEVQLIENQNDFAANKTIFANDYISYQQSLEELINIDCKNEPKTFYDKLEIVRKKRKIMEQDVLKMRSLLSTHLKLVNGLMEKL